MAYRQTRNRLAGAKTGVYDFAKDDDGETLVLGLREKIEDKSDKDITQKTLKHSATVDVYSVPIRVPMIRDLVAMKRAANRAKDRSDIAVIRKTYADLKL